jgi:hypothetical protein
MPDPTDFVTDLPADFEIFGDAADASVKALNPGTTAGDVDYYTSSTAKARLGIGTAGQVLKVNSGATAPEWGTVSAGGSSFTLLNAGGTSLSGNNTVTISSIDAEKLVIFITGTRMTNASSAITVRFNTDTGTNYARVFTRTTAGSTYAATNFSTTANINATSFQVLTSSSNTDSFSDSSSPSGISIIFGSISFSVLKSHPHLGQFIFYSFLKINLAQPYDIL